MIMGFAPTHPGEVIKAELELQMKYIIHVAQRDEALLKKLSAIKKIAASTTSDFGFTASKISRIMSK